MGARLDSESNPLIAALAQINRLGFFTDQSQPGVPIEDGCGQRAFVSGYCSETLAAVVSAELLGSELVAIVIPPGGSSGGQVFVTVDEGKEFTWVGIAGTSFEAADEYLPDTSMTFASLLSQRWQLQIFDPRGAARTSCGISWFQPWRRPPLRRTAYKAVGNRWIS